MCSAALQAADRMFSARRRRAAVVTTTVRHSTAAAAAAGHAGRRAIDPVPLSVGGFRRLVGKRRLCLAGHRPRHGGIDRRRPGDMAANRPTATEWSPRPGVHWYHLVPIYRGVSNKHCL